MPLIGVMFAMMAPFVIAAAVVLGGDVVKAKLNN